MQSDWVMFYLFKFVSIIYSLFNDIVRNSTLFNVEC